MRKTIPMKARGVASAREAVEGADIVVTATAVFKERKALVKREWVKPGALLTPLEVDTALDASLVYEPDLLVVDDIEQTLAFRKMGCFAEGRPTIHAELGEIVAGRKTGTQGRGGDRRFHERRAVHRGHRRRSTTSTGVRTSRRPVKRLAVS